jgi:hypothetical protein
MAQLDLRPAGPERDPRGVLEPALAAALGLAELAVDPDGGSERAAVLLDAHPVDLPGAGAESHAVLAADHGQRIALRGREHLLVVGELAVAVPIEPDRVEEVELGLGELELDHAVAEDQRVVGLLQPDGIPDYLLQRTSRFSQHGLTEGVSPELSGL